MWFLFGSFKVWDEAKRISYLWTVGFRHFSFFSSSFARKCVKSDTRVLMSFQLFVANHAVWTCSLDWRTLPTACEITAHLIRQDPPINGRSHCSSQPFKSRRSRTFGSAPRLRRGKPRFCCRVVPLWHISQKHHWKHDGVCVRAFVSTFRFYRRMPSTLLCALIFLACALTFSGAQSEYNLASCNMETLNWFPCFNILWFHLFLMKAFPGMLQVFSACTRSYLLC